MIPKILTAQQIYEFFPHTLEDIEKRVSKAMHDATDALEEFYIIEDDGRTVENTLYAFDTLVSTFNSVLSLFYSVEAVYSDEVTRQAAHHNALKLHAFGVDNIWQNNKLYRILKEYKDKAYNALSEDQRYFLDEQLKAYERHGVHLVGEVRDRLRDILKELGEHALAFDRNIALDIRSIKVTREQLAGLPDLFIEGLRKEGELYSVAVDYPTYFAVMENCSVETTRAALWHEFVNRAYPINEQELAQIIALRDEFAKLCGFESFAALDIQPQMAKSPERVERFILDLIKRSDTKVQDEVAILKRHRQPEVTLTAEERFKPWDFAYVKDKYKKEYLRVDENVIAEYFPLEHTIEKLLGIYEQFLGLTFKKSHFNAIWHEHVEYIQVYKGDTFIGSLLMDLFPRPGKYTHACHITLVPTVTRGDFYPGLSLVIANFPWPRAGQPALLQRNDVLTFFHEFGHAVHALLGSTEFELFAGTSVKEDFVEMPSQMLEEWMWDPEMLKMVSSHYKTGESLPDETIKGILALRAFDSGYWVQRQAYFSLLSLHCFTQGAYKDIDKMHRLLFEHMFSYIQFIQDNHDYAAFGHLTGYAAKYYGYLWSKVFALDMFEYIKQHGLLNPEVGIRYRDVILSKGGSKDPEKLLQEFLGREPILEPFLKAFGL